MRKLTLFIAALIFFSEGFAQSGKFQLTAKLPSGATGKAYLSYLGIGGVNRRDSAMADGGAIRFTGQIPHPSIARIFFNGKMKEVFLEPRAITLTASSNDISTGKCSGSVTQAEYEKLDKEMSKIRNRWKIVMDTLSAINKRSNMLYQEYKEWVLSPYFEEVKDAQLAFFDKYPASYVTAWLLTIYGRDLTTDSLKLLYARLPNAVQRSTYGQDISTMIDNRRIGVPGAMAAGFSAPDLEGQKLELAQFKGRYVLLDFWGSWCLPCRKSHPHLKKLYAKYKSKGVEFIGVAQEYNDNKETWRKAIKEDQLDWPQIMTIRTPEGDLVEKYNIDYFPTKILIDKDGVIIGRYGEKDLEQLDAKLESIFNN